MDFGHGRFYRGKDALILNYTHSDSFCKGRIVNFFGMMRGKGRRPCALPHKGLRFGNPEAEPGIDEAQCRRVMDRVKTLDAEDGQMDTGFSATSFSRLPACALTIACLVKPLVVQSPSVATSMADAAMRSPFRVSTKRLDTAWLAGMCTVYRIR